VLTITKDTTSLYIIQPEMYQRICGAVFVRIIWLFVIYLFIDRASACST